MPFVPSPIT